MPSNEVAKAITNSFKRKLHDDGITWKKVPEAFKDSYFEEFEKQFFWEPVPTELIRKAWAVKAAERYKDLIYLIKKDRLKKRPVYIREDVWPQWLATWDSEPVRTKAEKARQNRMSEPDGPGTGIVKHTGGSRSAQHHAIALGKEKGLPPDHCAWEVFNRLHCTNGVYSDAKSARIAAEVLARAEALRQPAEGCTEVPEVDMNQVYLDVVGVSGKNRVFGVGCQSQTYTGISQHGSSTHSVATSQPVSQDVLSQIEVDIEARVQARVESALQAAEERNRQMFQ